MYSRYACFLFCESQIVFCQLSRIFSTKAHINGTQTVKYNQRFVKRLLLVWCVILSNALLWPTFSRLSSLVFTLYIIYSAIFKAIETITEEERASKFKKRMDNSCSSLLFLFPHFSNFMLTFFRMSNFIYQNCF